MTARSRERGSHAGQSRGYGLSRLPGASRLPGGSRLPGHNGHPVTADDGTGPAVPPIPPGAVPQGPVGGGGFSRPSSGSRHRKHASKKALVSKRQKQVVALVATAGILSWGFVTGFNTESSPEGAVQDFLLDWQQGNFMRAAELTSGAGTYHEVATQLSAAYSDLDASAAFLSMGPVTQHGNTAEASFEATVDFADGSHQWKYNGKFGLTSVNGKWYVSWAPSVINPSLGPGDRLAVVSSYAPRAQVEDAAGRSLQQESADYHIGVIPGRLANPSSTIGTFAAITRLDAQQVLGQVRAAPPGDFLSLLTLDPADFRSVWPRLSKISGLSYQQKSERLFSTDADEAVGGVGGENADVLRDAGAAYEPGDTVGESGLEQAFQNSLLGTPTTSVVVVNPAGKTVTTLWTVRGHAGTPVRTTIDGQYQAAAARVLAAQPESGEIVAVDSATGDITALAATGAKNGGVPLPAGGPLDGK
ncbi:MAG: NTF2-like N-terminal transpeptidase domain-containing protein, partial [Trebonia sp.]